MPKEPHPLASKSENQDRPTVCHVTTVHPAGDTRIFHKECLSLSQAGYNVHLVARSQADQVIGNIRIHALPTPAGRLERMLVWPWLAYRKVLSLKPAPEIVHLHDPELLPAGQALRLKGFKVIFDVHENVAGQILDKRYLSRPLRQVVSLAYRIAEGFLTSGLATVHVLDTIADRYRPPKVVLHNFPSRCRPGMRRKSRFPQPHPPRLIYIGEISQDRGALVMIHAAAELDKRGFPCELRLIGPIYEAGLEDRMRKAIVQAGLGNRVNLMGRLDYEQAMEELSAADVGLCLLAPVPNYFNSLPTKVLEYMQTGLPVVASDFPCWRQYIAATGAGVHVPPQDVSSIADAVQFLLADPARIAKMGEIGRGVVETRFCWEKESPKLLAFYGKLLKGRLEAKPANPCNQSYSKCSE